MNNLDDAEFLDMLEQNVGRRWPRDWIVRLRMIMPWVVTWTDPGTTDARIQLDDIRTIRSHCSRRVLARLTD